MVVARKKCNAKQNKNNFKQTIEANPTMLKVKRNKAKTFKRNEAKGSEKYFFRFILICFDSKEKKIKKMGKHGIPYPEPDYSVYGKAGAVTSGRLGARIFFKLVI